MKNHPIRLAGVLLGLLLGAVPMAHAGVGVNATLTSKIFSPSTIAPSGTTTLTITVTNATAAQINGVTFSDTLPAGVTFVSFGSPTFSAGCVGSSLTATPTVVTGNFNVAANSFCAGTAVVTAGAPGVYTNSTSNISGWNGNALAFAPAVLAVSVNPIATPTLSEFALILLALGLAVLTYRIRFRRARSGADPPA